MLQGMLHNIRCEGFSIQADAVDTQVFSQLLGFCSAYVPYQDELRFDNNLLLIVVERQRGIVAAWCVLEASAHNSRHLCIEEE